MPAPVSKNTRRRVYVRDGFACVICGFDEDLTVDHVVPRAHGGTNQASNLMTMCGHCNSRKGDLSLSQHLVVLMLEGMTREEADRIRRAAREAQLVSTPGFEKGMVGL